MKEWQKKTQILKDGMRNSGKSPKILKHGIMEPRGERTKTLRNPKRRNNVKSREVLKLKTELYQEPVSGEELGKVKKRKKFVTFPPPLLALKDFFSDCLEFLLKISTTDSSVAFAYYSQRK